jgi:hypothetical protein
MDLVDYCVIKTFAETCAVFIEIYENHTLCNCDSKWRSALYNLDEN